MHIREPEVATLECEREPLVADAKAVQDGRVEIVDVYRLSDDVAAKVVGNIV